MKILLTGGGTLGSVVPLIAIKEELEKENNQFLWIGTKRGPEKSFLEKQGIEYKGIYAGKLRRYFSLKNIFDVFFIILGFGESWKIIKKYQPDIIISAGSFVSVPVVLAGWLFHRPILIHQLDIKIGLANRLMSFLATKITVGFKRSLNDYPQKKTVWTGNPIRNLLNITENKNDLKRKFLLKDNLPILLILGGGTGAMVINKLVEDNLEELTKFWQIIHITGVGKLNKNLKQKRYYSFEFLDNLPEVYKIADGVVCRAGIGTLSELSILGKPALVIPLPKTHQEENADIYLEAGAILLGNQKSLTSEKFIEKIKKIMYNTKLIAELSENIKKLAKENSNQEIVKIIKNIAQ